MQGVESNYVKACLEAFPADPELFYRAEYDEVLKDMVLHIIDQEGPIHEDVVVRRLARRHGFQRAGRQIRDRVVLFAASCRAQTQEDVGTFYWPAETGAEVQQVARIKGRDEEVKKLDYICSQELAEILTVCGDKGDFVTFCQALGIGRLTQQMRSRLEGAASEINEAESVME